MYSAVYRAVYSAVYNPVYSAVERWRPSPNARLRLSALCRIGYVYIYMNIYAYPVGLDLEVGARSWTMARTRARSWRERKSRKISYPVALPGDASTLDKWLWRIDSGKMDVVTSLPTQALPFQTDVSWKQLLIWIEQQMFNHLTKRRLKILVDGNIMTVYVTTGSSHTLAVTKDGNVSNRECGGFSDVFPGTFRFPDFPQIFP